MMLSYKIMGTIASMAFVALFTAGVVVDSGPFRTQLNTSFTPGALLAVMLTYTPSNVALLAMLAGFIGGCSSLITHRSALVKEGSPVDQSALYRTESPIASMLRSLVAYLAFMAGVLVTTIAPFTATTPEQYVRFAAAVSFFAFVVGYDPTKFQGLLSVGLPSKSPTSGKTK
jgi:hypothetical protein